jgi:hypothetical protein
LDIRHDAQVSFSKTSETILLLINIFYIKMFETIVVLTYVYSEPLAAWQSFPGFVISKYTTLRA